MSDGLETTLGALVDSGGGFIQTGPFGSQLHARDYVEDGIPIIMPQQLGDNEIRMDGVSRVAEHDRDRLFRHVMREGDIVFSRRGDVTRRAYITKKEDGWLCGTGCLLLRLNHPDCDNRYLVRLLGLHEARSYLTRHAIGATMPNLNQGILASVPVFLPPKADQERIVDIVSAYDDLIEKNSRRIRLLEQSARLLYQEWFVRFRFPGYESTAVVDGVPEGWEKRRLDELADVTMGQSPPSSQYNEVGEGLPFHQGVGDFGDQFITHRVFTTAKNRISEPGDILCSVRAPVGRLNVTTDRVVIGRGLAAIRSRFDRQSFLLRQLHVHFHKEDMIGSGAIFASVGKKELFAQRMLTPDARLISLFEEQARPIDMQLRTLFIENGRLGSARDLLLPRLMNGEIAV